MDKIIENKVLQATLSLEQQLDAEIQRLDVHDDDNLERLRELRIAKIKKQAIQRQEWISKGHGEYDELAEEKDFFDQTKKSPNIVVLFYKDGSPRCKIVDHHLKILCKKHIEAKFCKLNVERCPFLTERLRISVIPTIALIKDNNTKDYIVGFTDLGNCDDFSTELLEWRIAHSGAIDYSGDLLHPPDKLKTGSKASNLLARKHTIRDDNNDSDDDELFS